jgi:ABC-type transporter Mla maintaining outer membrane lipid asymmetry permease subunit MlaE
LLLLLLLLLQVSEQVDSLRVLFTDPVDYLVTPRVLASMIAGPILNVLCFCMGEATPPACTASCTASISSCCLVSVSCMFAATSCVRCFLHG